MTKGGAPLAQEEKKLSTKKTHQIYKNMLIVFRRLEKTQKKSRWTRRAVVKTLDGTTLILSEA